MKDPMNVSYVKLMMIDENGKTIQQYKVINAKWDFGHYLINSDLSIQRIFFEGEILNEEKQK